MEYMVFDIPQDDTQAVQDKLNELAAEGWILVSAIHLPDQTIYDPKIILSEDVNFEHKVRYHMVKQKAGSSQLL